MLEKEVFVYIEHKLKSHDCPSTWASTINQQIFECRVKMFPESFRHNEPAPSVPNVRPAAGKTVPWRCGQSVGGIVFFCRCEGSRGEV